MKTYPINPRLAAKIAVWTALITCGPLWLPQAHGAPGTLATKPLFVAAAAQPNVIFALDDSGSMDWEVLMPTSSGELWWTQVSTSPSIYSFVGKGQNGSGDISQDGAINFNWAGKDSATAGIWDDYAYLFPNGNGSTSSDRLYTSIYALPPTPDHAFARSSSYNGMYYDPAVTYSPWTAYGSTSFSNASPTAAPYDPVNSTASTLDLTSVKYSTSSWWTFYLEKNMYPDSYYSSSSGHAAIATSGASVPSASDTIVTSTTTPPGGETAMAYYPATYFVKVPVDATHTFSCTGTTDPGTAAKRYQYFASCKPSKRVFTGVGNDAAVGPDGSLLVRYEIKSGTATYPKASTRTDCGDDSVTTCTYAQEIQNFANWFTYYRKRHLAARAGIGGAFNGIDNIRLGYYNINSLPSGTISMLDTSVATNVNTFYSWVYNRVPAANGTPDRAAVNAAGVQLMKTGSGAPITAACQINAAILMTDGYENGSYPSVGNTDSGKGTPYADAYSDTMADMVMKYYSNNLRTDLTAGKVPVPTACSKTPPASMDCNKNLHMNFFGITLGAKGLKYGYSPYAKVADAYTTPPTWANPTTTDNPMQIDDIYHAAVNGRGEMFDAENPQDINTHLTSTLQNIEARVGTGAAVAFNTTSLNTNTDIYQSLFDSGVWSGDMLAYKMDATTVSLIKPAVWSAADQINSQDPTCTSCALKRTIITYNASTRTGIPFRWDTAKLSSTQQADLNMSPTGTADGYGSARLDWLRGDRTHETGSAGVPFLRQRDLTTVLGDIVHSSPVYVAGPELNYPDSAPFPSGSSGYSTFKAAWKSRARTIYVGANDGMLHALDASTGSEIMAYVPHSLFSSSSGSGLHYLTDKAYAHRYYVDQTPTVSDAYIKTSSTDSLSWKTVLVGGLNGGGRGVYALNVTDPSTFSESGSAPSNLVMWEFNSSIDADLGYTYSTPSVALMNNGRWAAIFGNGYNNSGTGTAKLFIVYLDGGFSGTWTAGTSDTTSDYLKIDTKAGSTTTLNGLSTPTLVDLDGNGTVDRIYAGDLQGNIWVFDVSDGLSANWKPAYGTTTTPVALFTAKNGAGTAQPITVKPTVVRNPAVAKTTLNAPDILVLFGTGQYVATGDPTTTTTQTFYGVWDKGSLPVSTTPLTRTALVAQTVDSETGGLRTVSSNTVDYAAKYGWYIDLNIVSASSGERVIDNPKVRGDFAFFNTMIPSTDACSAGGSSWVMMVNLKNGGGSTSAVFDTNGDGVVDSKDTASAGILVGAVVTDSVLLGIPKTSATDATGQVLNAVADSNGDTHLYRSNAGAAPSARRISWREILPAK